MFSNIKWIFWEFIFLKINWNEYLKSIENRISVDILKYKFTKEFIKESGIGLKINIDLFLKYWNYISYKDIFGKINNLENYLESGDVGISIDSSKTDYQYLPLNRYLLWLLEFECHTYFWISAHYSG